MIFSHLEVTKLISEVALIGLKKLRPLVVRDCSTKIEGTRNPHPYIIKNHAQRRPQFFAQQNSKP